MEFIRNLLFSSESGDFPLLFVSPYLLLFHLAARDFFSPRLCSALWPPMSKIINFPPTSGGGGGISNASRPVTAAVECESKGHQQDEQTIRKWVR
jgi:hypothetical protein